MSRARLSLCESRQLAATPHVGAAGVDVHANTTAGANHNTTKLAAPNNHAQEPNERSRGRILAPLNE
jgi:hypothetical protein